MGDRISVSFVTHSKDFKGNPYTLESVALFHHWGGMDFLKTVRTYFQELHRELKGAKRKGTYPIDRLEPQTLMVDFIRWLTRMEKRVESSLYLGIDQNDGDNSDNGHFQIDTATGKPTIVGKVRITGPEEET